MRYGEAAFRFSPPRAEATSRPSQAERGSGHSQAPTLVDLSGAGYGHAGPTELLDSTPGSQSRSPADNPTGPLSAQRPLPLTVFLNLYSPLLLCMDLQVMSSDPSALLQVEDISCFPPGSSPDGG